MNPKIADFGMARNFRVDQTEDMTGRVVGTLLVFYLSLVNPICFYLNVNIFMIYLQRLHASRVCDTWPILYQI